MINNRIWGPKFKKEEAEIRKLKAELARIDVDKEQPSLFTKMQSLPISTPLFNTYQPFYNPSRPPMDYNKFFGLSHLLYRDPTPPSPSKKPATKVKISEPKPKETSPIPEDSPKATLEPRKDKAPVHQYFYQSVGLQGSDPNSDTSSYYSSISQEQSSSDLESQYAYIFGLLMVQQSTKTEEPSTSTPVVDESDDENADQGSSQTEPIPPNPPAPETSSKPSSTQWFTFDDIPHHKWPGRYQEFAAWVDVQMTRPNAHSQTILREFCSRLTSSLRDWFESLGEYRQLQLIQTTVVTALTVIYEQFIGEPAAANEASKKEFHQMKCCSPKRNHLEMHYKRMSMLYYKLNGFNYSTLKHVFIASLPPELQSELQRQLTTFNLDIANISLGKFFQLTMLCLDRLCEQKDFFKDLIENEQPFALACKKPYLKIQCKDDKKCTCPTKKKAVRLIQHLEKSSLHSEHDEVESNFCEQIEYDDHIAFILAESTDDSEIDEIFVISTVQEVSQVNSKPTALLVRISVLPSMYHKPTLVIGFLDTGAQRSMLNPIVLHSSCWEKHTEFFKAANGEIFKISLITKKTHWDLVLSKLYHMAKNRWFRFTKQRSSHRI
ncbi:hypothetical protein KPL70_003592 [Citrus sinensis]|nr:hypothetical protein KPL70_003592 [Citrus sinensis]